MSFGSHEEDCHHSDPPSPGDTRNSYSFLRVLEMKSEEVSQDTQNADSPPTRGTRVPRTCSVVPGLKAWTRIESLRTPS